MKKCSSCNSNVSDDFSEFKCPACGKETIVRCKHCRQTAKKFECVACGFVGP